MLPPGPPVSDILPQKGSLSTAGKGGLFAGEPRAGRLFRQAIVGEYAVYLKRPPSGERLRGCFLQ
ncbi:hypothetical protein GCM10009414_12480 [Tatumella terrea]